VENVVHLGATWAGGILLILLLHLQERVTSRHIAHHLGWKGVLITGWLGVPVHELSHLVFAALFGHRIIAWRLFDPDPASGTLGYVRHAYSRRSPWQLVGGFPIAVAPLVGGALVLGGLCCWMAPAVAWSQVAREASSATGLAGQVLGAAAASLGAVWRHRSPWLPLQIYLGVCVSSHMAPSQADLKGGLPGAVLAALITAAGAAAAAYSGHALTAGTLVLALLLLLLLAASVFQGTYAAAVNLTTRLTRRHGGLAIR
jgi:hypothetical protein